MEINLLYVLQISWQISTSWSPSKWTFILQGIRSWKKSFAPIRNWIKCNYDISVDSHTNDSGDIFRDSIRNFILGFVEPNLFTNSLHAMFSTIFRAIEIGRKKPWIILWIEIDSLIVYFHMRESWLGVEKQAEPIR